MKSVFFTAAALLPSIGVVALETTAELFSQREFDFIVVGGGTSGIVAATRLSEDPNVVVGIIEAGQYRPDDPVIEIPNSWAAPSVTTGLLGNPTYDWGFVSIPQPGLNGKPVPYPRGRVVGGSSAINSMIWQRGAREEYDLWSTSFGNGAENWTFAGMLPYFKKVETWSPPPASPTIFPLNSSDIAAAHGTNGPLKISYNNYLTDVDGPSVQAAHVLGVPLNSNPDLGNRAGFSPVARNVDQATGLRRYAGNSYYKPNAQRQNLVLLTGAQATKILFGKTKAATGVQYIVNGTTYTAHVKKELILAAGSLKTAPLLELSGVGNKDLLHGLGIPCVLDLPAIGENLQDHPIMVSDYKLKASTITLDTLGNNVTFLLQQRSIFNASGQGALSFTPAALGPTPIQTLFGKDATTAMIDSLKTSLHGMTQSALTKVQHHAQLKLLQAGEVPFLELVVVPSGGVAGTPAPNTSYVSIAVMEVHPFGRGSVHINTTDPLASPVIDPRYFEVPFDAELLIKAAQWTREWMLTGPMAELVEAFDQPSASVNSTAAWDSYVRAHVQSTNHPMGSTPMAPQSMGGVVDPQLKVYGLANVRIIDAGIFPFTISVPLQPTVYAIAEKAADMIKAAWRLR
ncbi:alcohol oxidase [Mycena latifolia]|nr:alcohol oxidase [Mycena latifolia]